MEETRRNRPSSYLRDDAWVHSQVCVPGSSFEKSWACGLTRVRGLVQGLRPSRRPSPGCVPQVLGAISAATSGGLRTADRSNACFRACDVTTSTGPLPPRTLEFLFKSERPGRLQRLCLSTSPAQRKPRCTSFYFSLVFI